MKETITRTKMNEWTYDPENNEIKILNPRSRKINGVTYLCVPNAWSENVKEYIVYIKLKKKPGFLID